MMKKVCLPVLVCLVFVGVCGIQYANSQWIGGERFTRIGIKGTEVKIESFDPKTLVGFEVKLPDTLLIETVSGRGKWPVEVLGKMGNKYGMSWAKSSVADFLGIAFVPEPLSLWDEIRWWWWKGRVRWRQVDMEKSGLVREIKAPDGDDILVLTNDWKSRADNLFLSSELSDKGITVAIINTTGVLGLGSHAARPIESAGIRVVDVANESQEIGKCEILSDKRVEHDLVVLWLKKELGCIWKAQGGFMGADVTIRLGDEYKIWWLGKDTD